jgi:hypothetical protein
MRYLLDTHSLTNRLINRSSKRADLFVIDEVADEYAFVESEISKITSAGISIVSITKKHLDKLKEIMETHGSNLKLIRLCTGKGSADVLMLAYLVSERDHPESLFTEEYTLVTRDKELTAVAKSYKLKVITSL